MENVKAIFLDMDGTILHKNNLVSEQSATIISNLREAGYKVFLATGRSHDEIKYLVPKNFEVDGIISSNGTLGVVHNEVVFQHSLSLSSVKEIVSRAQEQHIYYEVFPFEEQRAILKEDYEWTTAMLQGDTPPGNVGESEWSSRKDALAHKVNWVPTIDFNSFAKIYLFATDYDAITQFRAQLVEDQEELKITVSNSSRYNAETMAYHVDKGTGIKEMIEHFGIQQHETLVIGDSDNDRAMFGFGHYTVAMKNARPEIQALAQDVTSLTNEEDGAALYLKDKFLV